jgi:flagellar biogenesis protein FliO
MFARVVFALFFVAAPGRAFASGLTGAAYDLGAEEASITLTASGAFSEPEVRTERGYVRVWLRGMSGDVRFDPQTDGTAVRWIRIRPGFSDTTVVVVKIGDNREIPDSAVRVEWGESTARILLARSALPELPSQPVPVAAPAAEEAPVSPPEEAVEETAAIEDAPASSPVRANPATTARAPSSFGIPSDTSTIPLLLLITAVLGALYVGVKFVLGKRKKNPLADIEIVASKRLGTRHQIVLVRALGEDHLLSINGTQTQCIASTPSAMPAEPPPAGEKVPERASAILRRLEDHVAKQRKLATGDLVPPKPMVEKKPTPVEQRFGKELMRFAIENEEPKPIPIRPMRVRRHSEAVRGLVELRERLAAG